jgi:hypothetical protein
MIDEPNSHRGDFKPLQPDHKTRVLRAVEDFLRGRVRPKNDKRRRRQEHGRLFDERESLEIT